MTPLCWGLLIAAIVFGAPLLVLVCASANMAGLCDEEERRGR